MLYGSQYIYLQPHQTHSHNASYRSSTRCCALLFATLAAFLVSFLLGVVSNDATESTTSVSTLLARLTKAKMQMEQLVRHDYGEYANLLFDREELMRQNNIDGKGMFTLDEDSRRRLKRRMMIKVAQAVLQDDSVRNSTSSHNRGEERRQFSTMSSFVWATGGDSNAAGHGNLFRQSYTAVLEHTVQDAFEAVGIKFEARNYAMGGYVSAPELALCMESVYGSDLDILAWDFAMSEAHTATNDNEGEFTDWTHQHQRAALWASRASMHRTRPILVLMDEGETTVDADTETTTLDTSTTTSSLTNSVSAANAVAASRWKVFQTLNAQHKMAVLRVNGKMPNIKRHIPDAVAGDQLGSSKYVPKTLRNFMCHGLTEGIKWCADATQNFRCAGDEGIKCELYKFDTRGRCEEAKYQDRWHAGWKDHFLKGKLIGFYLVELLHESILDIQSLLQHYRNKHHAKDDTAAWNIVLASLHMEEEEDALSSSPTSSEKDQSNHQLQVTDYWKKDLATLEEVGTDVVFWKKQVMCHTALFPAQIRFHEIVTGTKHRDKGKGYDRGTSRWGLDDIVKHELPLTYDPDDRQQCQELEVDHKDFFSVRQGDGWLSTIVPNDDEIAAYGYGVVGGSITTETHMGEALLYGMILVCNSICSGVDCVDDDLSGLLRLDLINKRHAQVQIKVDDRPVVAVLPFDGCYFLVGEGGIQWARGEAGDGKYKLSFRVNLVDSWMKISSIVVF